MCKDLSTAALAFIAKIFECIVSDRSPTPTCPVSLIYLKPLGATHVVDHNLPPLEIKKIANQSIPFDAIADRPTQQAGLNILAPGGTLVTVLAEKVKAQNKTMIHVAALLTAPPHLKLLETLSGKKLSGWLEEVVIKPNRVEFIPGGLEVIPAG